MPRFDHDRLRRIRLELGLSQQDAAEAVGVTVRTWRRYESGAVNQGGDFSVRHASRQQFLHRLCEQLGVDAPEDWLIEAPGEGGVRASGHPLPPARGFTGRAAELERLRRFALGAEGAPAVLVIVGVGGMGKTSLAAALLGEPALSERRRFVWSFYDDDRVEAFFAEAVAALGGAGPATGRRLLACLGEGAPGLLVLDGLEVVQSAGDPLRAAGELEPPPLRRLLRGAAALGSAARVRVLVTSRLPLVDLAPWAGHGAETLALTPLRAEAARAALESAWGLSPEAAAAAAPLAGGHALSVAVLGAYVSEVLGGDAGALRDLPLTPDAATELVDVRRLRAVIAAYMEALPALERDLLARAAALSGEVDAETLRWMASQPAGLAGALAGASAEMIGLSLRRLRARGLLDEGSAAGRLTMHPFLRESFRALLDGPTASRLRDRLATARLDRHHPTTAAADEQDALIAALLDAGRPEAAYRVYARSVGGFDQLGLREGDWLRGLRLVRRFSVDGSPERMRPGLAAERRALLSYEWGLYAGALGDLEDALRGYSAHIAHAEGLQEESRRALQATGHRTRAYTLRLRGDAAAALLDVDRSLALSAGRWDLLRGAALRAAILHDLGETDAAAEAFAAAEAALGRAPTARWGLWHAEHLLERGDLAEATARTQANLALCTRRGWAGHMAHCQLLLADADLPARRGGHRGAARRWVVQTGEMELTLRLHLSAARAAPTEHAAAGLALARATGLGWFVPRFTRLLSP